MKSKDYHYLTYKDINLNNSKVTDTFRNSVSGISTGILLFKLQIPDTLRKT